MIYKFSDSRTKCHKTKVRGQMPTSQVPATDKPKQDKFLQMNAYRTNSERQYLIKRQMLMQKNVHRTIARAELNPHEQKFS